MSSKEYISKACVTESKNFSEIGNRLNDPAKIRILHATIGACTEAGELLDAVKKHVFYGKELDTVNLFEEVGDIFWYLAILADELGFDFESVMNKNIEKLAARYKGSFSEVLAEKRDLKAEREILED